MSDPTTPDATSPEATSPEVRRRPRHAAPAEEAETAVVEAAVEAAVVEAAVVDAAVVEAAIDTSALDTDLPPDAAARDAAKRDELPEADPAIHGEDIRFVTRGVSDAERAAVIAVLTAVRSEETQRVKRVARRDREPWARSQRVPDRISELLAEG